MISYNPGTHGEWRGPVISERQPGPRVVHDGPDGTIHGHNVNGVAVGCLLSGPGKNEAGQTVVELLSAAKVAARATAATEAAAEATRHGQVAAALVSLFARVKPPANQSAAANLTNGEVRALLVLLRGMRE